MIGGARAHHRDHAPVAGPLAGLLHQPAAQRHQLEPVAVAQAAGRDQRGQLAERMAGHHVAVGAPECLPAGEARAEDRRLRETRAFLGARERILSDDLIDEREEIRARLGHGFTHLRGLAPLTWKQDRGDSHSAITLRSILGPDTGAGRSSPRSGGGPKCPFRARPKP